MKLQQAVKFLYEKKGETFRLLPNPNRSWWKKFWDWVSRSKPWCLSIEETKETYTIYRLSDINSHSRAYGPCYAITINKHDGSLQYAYKQAITMWMVYNEKEKQRIYCLMKNIINYAVKLEKLTK